jgi:hypothetical protein
MISFNFLLIFNVSSLELGLFRNLLQTHVAIDFKLDCIVSIVSIKEINDTFNNKLPLLNTKQTKEVFFDKKIFKHVN